MSIPFLSTPSSRRQALFLLLLLFVVLMTRLPFLMHGLDELDSANFALSVVHFDIMGDQPHAPGQYFYVRLMQFVHQFGGSELFTLSLASAFGSSLALVPYYLTLRQVFGPRVAAGASVLTAFTFGYWITSLRMVSDPVATLFVYGTVGALLAGLRDRRWFVFGMALCGVTLGMKQTAVYFLAPLAVAVNIAVLFRQGWRRPLLGSVAFAVVIAAWLLPTVHNCQGWANYVGRCRDKQQENYLTESLIFHLTSGATKTQWQHNLLQPWGASALANVMLVLAAGGLILCLRRGLRGELFVLFSLTVAFYAFFFLYRFNKYFVYYVPIYCAFAAAALFALGEYLALELERPVLRSLVPGVAIACVTVVNFGVVVPLLPRISHFRAPPQAALEALHRLPGVEATPLLLTDDSITERELLYFHLQGKVDLLNRHPDLRTASNALDAGRKIYFLSPTVFAADSDQPDAVRLLGTYAWRPELYEPLQGRAELRQLLLYELRAPLPTEYLFKDGAIRAPLLLGGMWEDGWCGADTRLLLPCDESGTGLAHLRLASPEEFGYRYPYRLTCQFADGKKEELTIAHAGHFDFVVPLPDHPGAHTVELRLLAPQTYRPADHQPLSQDHRALSVRLETLDCVTESRPLLVRHEEGWHQPETDGNEHWRWTDGNAVLSVFTARSGTLVLNGTVRSLTDYDALEVLADAQPGAVLPLPSTDWRPLGCRLPLAAGYHLITLHSRLPGQQMPGDTRTLALCVRDLQTRFEP